jgi:hypothetical protein
MTAGPRESPRFTLEEANALLPAVRRLTDQAVHDAESLARRMQKVGPGDAQYEHLDESLNARIVRWAADIEALGAEVKGLWLVDFDAGDGYYCWKHPEPTVAHYHGYTEGFAGRMKIV